MVDSRPEESGNSVRLVRRLWDALGASGPPRTILLKISLSEEAADELLAAPGVASLIMSAPSEKLARRYPGRVGWCHEDGRSITIPKTLSREMLYAGGVEDLGFRATLLLWRSGVRRWLPCGAGVEPPRRHWMVVAVAGAFLRAVAPNLYQLGVARFPGFMEALLTLYITGLRRYPPRVLPRPVEPVPRRIVLAIGNLGPAGSERQLTNTLVGLAARGHSGIALLHEAPMWPPNDFYLRTIRASPVAVSRVRSFHSAPGAQTSNPNLASAIGSLRLFSSVRDQIHAYALEFLERRPQVVHTWLDHINVTAGLAAAMVGVPRVVLSCRSLGPRQFAFFQPYMKGCYLLLARFPSVVFLNNSEAGARNYENWLGLERGRVRVIHNGFDFSAFPSGSALEAARREYREHLGMPAGAPVVGAVMRLSEEKRPMLWLGAAALVARQMPHARFLIVGDGPMKSDLLEASRELGIEEKTTFAGLEADVFSAMAAMDILLLTSRVEGLPNVLIEAQALGVPVVATAVGGAEETFQDGVTGLAVREPSPEAVARAVARVLADPDWAKLASEHADLLVRRRFSAERMIRETLQAYGLSSV
jgi:glycosyltransferase involved in cell wall biosynthesis